MNNNLSYEKSGAANITGLVCDKTVWFESAADYSFPDYQAPIRRLLHVEAKVLPPARYVGAKGVEFNGNVDYRILYMGGDGGIYALPMSSEYSVNIPFESVSDGDMGVSVIAHIDPRNISARVVSAEKISLRTRLCANVRAFGKLTAEEMIPEGVAPFSLCKKRESVRTLAVNSFYTDAVEAIGEIELQGEDTRVVYADGEVFVTDTEVRGNELIFKGDVTLRVMTADGEGETKKQEKKIAVEGVATSEGALGEDTRVSAVGHMTELTVEIEEGKIILRAEVVAEMTAMSNTQVEYTSDMYSTEKDVECGYRKLDTPTSLLCKNCNFSVNERIGVKDIGIPEGAEVVDGFCRVEIDRCECESGSAVMTGTSRFTVVTRSDGEYSSGEVAFPVRFETDAPEGVVGYSVRADAMNVRVGTDGESINLSSETVVALELLGNESVTLIEGARAGDDIPRRRGETVVCFPATNEGIWDIAKRYKVTEEQVRASDGDSFALISFK